MLAGTKANDHRKKRTKCYLAHPACCVFFTLSAPVGVVTALNLADAIPTADSARRMLLEQCTLSDDAEIDIRVAIAKVFTLVLVLENIAIVTLRSALLPLMQVILINPAKTYIDEPYIVPMLLSVSIRVKNLIKNGIGGIRRGFKAAENGQSACQVANV